MISVPDGEYLSELMRKSGRLATKLMESQEAAYKDKHYDYHRWVNALDKEQSADMVVLCAITSLGKSMLFEPVVEGFKTSQTAMQHFAGMVYRYDNGPYRVPTNLPAAPYTSVDAAHFLKILDMVSDGHFIQARQLALLVSANALSVGNGSIGQLLFVAQNISMIMAFSPTPAKQQDVELRATSLRTMFVAVCEDMKRTGWCVPCGGHIQRILGTMDDRKGSGTEPGSDPDQGWISMMKKEWEA